MDLPPEGEAVTDLPVPFATVPASVFDGDPYRDVPWCTKCNKRVERFSVVTPIYCAHPHFFDKMRHTGEVIVTVECHGEMFKISNWYGVVEATYMPFGET